MEKEKRYSFEQAWNAKVSNAHQLSSDMQRFSANLGFNPQTKFSDEEEILLESFYRDNLYNIVWYRRRIKREAKMVNLYSFFTLLILIGVPVFLYLATMSTWSDELGVANLNSAEKIGSGITVLLSSLLALHKFTSSWLDRRIFNAQFHQASTELKEILYDLQGSFFGRAQNGNKSFLSQQKGRVFSDDFIAALRSASKLSKAVVSAETKAYFEKRANPSFDIAGIWHSSALAAREAFGNYKSGTWKIEELREKVQSSERRKQEIAAELKQKKQEYQIQLVKLERLAKQEELISLQMDELESKLSTLNSSQLSKLDLLNKRFEKIQEQIEDTEFTAQVLEMETASLAEH